MQKTDYEEFLKIIIGTGELYEKIPSANSLELYWDDLKELSLDELRRAITQCRRDPERGRFMPKPADILHFARPRRTAVMIWAEVVRAMEKIGAYESVYFENGTITAVIKDLGGWPWICSQNLEEPWTQKEFERRYEQYSLQGIALAEPIIGLHEAHNQAKGLLDWIRQPAIIGGRNQYILPEPPPALRRLSLVGPRDPEGAA